MASRRSQWTVVIVDMVGYSTIAGSEEHFFRSARIVGMLDAEVQKIVDKALHELKKGRKDAKFAKIGEQGDDAIILLPDAADAHGLVRLVFEEAQRRNIGGRDSQRQWKFSAGAATGEIDFSVDEGGDERASGYTFSRAARFQSAASAFELVVDTETHRRFPEEIQTLYGAVEMVPGKREEEFAAHRWAQMADVTGARENEGGFGGSSENGQIDTCFDLFSKLNPKDQLEQIMAKLRMPEGVRPASTIALDGRFSKLVDWASREVGGLTRLLKILRDLAGE